MIFLVRHAKAQVRLNGVDHPQRALTNQGKQQAILLADWIGTHQPVPQLIFTSPFRRCLETAEPIAAALRAPLQTADWLAHGASLAGSVEQIMALPQDSSVLLVGHEPELSNLLACLLPPTNQNFSFSKAGIACMEPRSDGWRLLWHYRYKQLLARK